MSEFINIGLAFAIGFYLGYKFMRLLISASLQEIAEEEGIDLGRLRKKVLARAATDINNIVFVNIEEHQEKIYAFDKINDTFLCQGSSLDDIAKNLKEQHNVLIARISYRDEDIWALNGQIKKELQEIE